MPKKGERLGKFADLRGGLAKEGGCFWGGGDTPMHTMNPFYHLFWGCRNEIEKPKEEWPHP